MGIPTPLITLKMANMIFSKLDRNIVWGRDIIFGGRSPHKTSKSAPRGADISFSEKNWTPQPPPNNLKNGSHSLLKTWSKHSLG